MMKSEASSSFRRATEKGNMKTKPWRKLWHLLGGSFFPVLAFFVPKEALLITLGAMTGVFVAWEIARLNNASVNRWMASHLGVILKNEERYRPTGTTCLLISSLAVFFLFDKYVAITSLLFVSIGDLVATVIGEEYGRQMLFNNKTLEGSLACLASCLLIGMLMSRISPSMALEVAMVGAVSATIIELLPIPVDDNLTIPLLSAGAMMLTTFYSV
jgi:glycerol-3-phosphate acyltransferase PlsY